jgi:hypothetical protein
MNSFIFILNNNLYNIQKELFESNTDFFIRIDFIKKKLSNESNNLSIDELINLSNIHLNKLKGCEYL